MGATADGRLFAHGDERARIYELHPDSGTILKEFHLGRQGIRGDFEGLAIAGDRFFIVDSDGRILEFREGGDGDRVEYELISSGIGSQCEVEGLAYDVRSDVLLLPCKTVSGRRLRGHLVVYAFSLDGLRFENEPRYLVPLSELIDLGLEEDLNPSGIEVHPVTGSIYILAARQHALVELSRNGEPLAVRLLAAGAHAQAEGLTFGSDLSLFIADEAAREGAILTRYSLDGTRGNNTPESGDDAITAGALEGNWR